ncbi:hypothetical protein DVR12_13970 [Chitinophaga silvatica]|uniref:Uncharacterized protein n=1 Tax=Chitinophaga silvatica TaxID=2282649 RepID=A0A3E1Y8N3_9BACT|nr:hypothetical protein [Chitinophaga silvatica]RFS21763.1 hypothetical protein DVR12_13970 [Chitinophaga silvatica]
MITIRLFLLISILSCFLEVTAQEHYELKVIVSDKEHTFSKDVVSRQLTAQTQISPRKTLGFFTDRDENIPFYFSCVMLDSASDKISTGDYPLLRVQNDMPVPVKGLLKGGFLAIKMNDKVIANPEEYTSMPGSKNVITIKEINDKEIKGIFNARMECTSDTTKQLDVSGSFVIRNPEYK